MMITAQEHTGEMRSASSNITEFEAIVARLVSSDLVYVRPTSKRQGAQILPLKKASIHDSAGRPVAVRVGSKLRVRSADPVHGSLSDGTLIAVTDLAGDEDIRSGAPWFAKVKALLGFTRPPNAFRSKSK
jgi:hypothetical protein